ncbi:ATPase [Anaeromicropila populeti]|uniref:ATPase n=1 Tax=Anaeromicropila populeti TaxID=37658 RepID=A0A1I6KJA8_9FIRM|nr:ATPase [Anaeromicropila populeti]SFR90950.1 hypothetical protein SAMN05661086_02441 [Anaeromicropila populeti]
MGVSKIEQLIEDIYEFVESCKMQPLSSTKVIVPKDELYDLLDELRLRTPDEIKRYQKIISNRDAILSDAEEKATKMLAEAEAQTNALINEHEIMQQAYYQANQVVHEAEEEGSRMIQQANMDAEAIRQGAIAYTSDMLTQLENVLNNAYESTKNKYEGVLNSLKGNLEIVINNKKELYLESEPAGSYEENTTNYDTIPKDEFDFDENTFLEDID